MADALRVLIVDGSGHDAPLVAQELGRGGYDPEWMRVETPEQLGAALAGDRWDVVVHAGDLVWPPGPTVLELVRQSDLDLPFVVVADPVGQATVVELMRAGAHDVLAKDNLSRLSECVRRETRAAGLRAEHRRRDEALRESEQRYRTFFEEATARAEPEPDRLQSAEAIRRREEELRSIFSAVPAGIAVYVGPTVKSANDRMCELTGYSHAELEGTVTRYLYESEEEFERVGREAFRQVQETGRGSLETRWVRKDGVRIDVLASWAPIDAADLWRGVTVAALDITERKVAEDRLRRLAAAIEQSEEGVMITDPDGVIEYVNPAFERITGYLADEALHQHSRMLRSGKQDQAFYHQLWTTITSGRTWAGRLVNRRKDGTLYHQDCTISPVLGAEGRIQRFVAAMRDVTKSLRLEEDLRQSQRVESLGRLAAVVAHDFNNLLSPILGYAELLLSELHPSDERFVQIQEIESASRRARDLTRQLLAFGRKQALQIRPVDLNAVAGGIERLLRRALREDVHLTVSQHPSPCVVMADQGQAEQVVMNLAVNAQDAMPGGGRITVRIDEIELSEAESAERPETTPGRYGVLMVSDTGCGMDAETMRRIFEPFFSTKGERGTGLGLSTVYGIVKQHGGHVTVDSEVGRGSVFTVYLPSTDAHAVADARPARLAERPRASGTILLVEDDDAVRNLTQTILRREGYTVLSAAGGDEAMALLDEHPAGVHLLLTDVIMSGMDGRALHRVVMERCASVKVLFMSGHTDDVVADRGVLEGVPFVQKPFSVAGLAQKVREVLES